MVIDTQVTDLQDLFFCDKLKQLRCFLRGPAYVKQGHRDWHRVKKSEESLHLVSEDVWEEERWELSSSLGAWIRCRSEQQLLEANVRFFWVSYTICQSLYCQVSPCFFPFAMNHAVMYVGQLEAWKFHPCYAADLPRSCLHTSFNTFGSRMCGWRQAFEAYPDDADKPGTHRYLVDRHPHSCKQCNLNLKQHLGALCLCDKNVLGRHGGGREKTLWGFSFFPDISPGMSSGYTRLVDAH